jgi:tRNA nucleotidyltransferase (CCA-adding enzyme)
MVCSVQTLIVTHDAADFDALASQVAARKLYSDSELLLSPSLGRDVHPYWALHRDFFGGRTAAEIDWCAVERLVLVDVRRSSRLGHAQVLLDRHQREPGSLELVIYDHHPARADDVKAEREQIEPVGSTTTLLAEQIEARGVALNPIEATLLALGLHADTGSLSFLSTTSRDARALAFLLASGADMAVLTRYLHRALDAARRQLIAGILSAVEVHPLRGLSVGIASIAAAKRFSGLDEVTSRAHELSGCPVLFVMYDLGRGRILIVARSASRAIDLSAILATWGGGGQPEAGSVTRRDSSLERAREQLLEVLESQSISALTARDLMSSPVHTLKAETPLREAGRCLSEWKNGAAVVLHDTRPVAIISRSDLLGAERRGELHLAVKSCMSSRMLTAAPSASLDELAQSMAAHDIGRLPVLEQGRLIGIVTRSDIRRALYGRRAADPGSTAS